MRMFIGRDDELKKLKNWLESGEPSIAVTGKGGIGKTTLVKGFTSTRDFKRTSRVIYISLKGETEVVQPVKIVLEGIGKGLRGKVAEWWRNIKEVAVHGEVKLPEEVGASDKWRILYTKRLWSMDNFEKAKSVIEDASHLIRNNILTERQKGSFEKVRRC